MNTVKENYEAAQIEIISFENEDVITTSTAIVDID